MGAWVSNGLGYGKFSLVCKFKETSYYPSLSSFNIFFQEVSHFWFSSVTWLGLLGLEKFSKGLVPENSRLAAEEGKLSKKTSLPFPAAAMVLFPDPTFSTTYTYMESSWRAPVQGPGSLCTWGNSMS